MNSYQNQNGQFGGWGQNGVNTPQGYSPYYYEQQIKQQQKNNDKTNLRKMGTRFGIAVITYVALSFLMSFIIGFLSRYFPPLRLLYDDSTVNFAYSAIGSVLYIGIPFLAVYLSLKARKMTGVLPFGTTYNTKASIFLTMFLIPVMLITSTAINFISVIVQEILGLQFTSGLENLETNGIKGFVISVIAMAIIPAIVEEFSIRGVVMQPLRRYGDGFAIVASAFIFSIMHGNMAQIPYTVVGGLYLGYLVVATGSIWPSIFLHFINNMYSVVIMAVDSNFGEKASTVAVLVMMGIFIIIGVFGAVGFFSMNYKTKLAKGVDTLKTGEKISPLFFNVPMIIAILVMIAITVLNIEK